MEKPSAKDSTNGATLAERDLTKYLSDERTVAEPAPAASVPGDPATQRGPMPQLDYHHEAWERLREPVPVYVSFCKTSRVRSSCSTTSRKT